MSAYLYDISYFNRDNEHHHTSEKRQSVSEHEADLTTNARSVYRLVDRESKFQQAKYPIYVQRILPLEEVFKLFYAKDPVLAMTNISTLKGFLVMLLFFIFSCALTAIPWYLMGQNEYYREDCSVETTGFQRAFIFSSQVIMTIGKISLSCHLQVSCCERMHAMGSVARPDVL